VKQISTAELIEFIEERSGFVVDVRPVDAYNGWALKGEAQGGHQIPPRV